MEGGQVQGFGGLARELPNKTRPPRSSSRRRSCDRLQAYHRVRRPRSCCRRTFLRGERRRRGRSAGLERVWSRERRGGRGRRRTHLGAQCCRRRGQQRLGEVHLSSISFLVVFVRRTQGSGKPSSGHRGRGSTCSNAIDLEDEFHFQPGSLDFDFQLPSVLGRWSSNSRSRLGGRCAGSNHSYEPSSSLPPNRLPSSPTPHSIHTSCIVHSLPSSSTRPLLSHRSPNLLRHPSSAGRFFDSQLGEERVGSRRPPPASRSFVRAVSSSSAELPADSSAPPEVAQSVEHLQPVEHLHVGSSSAVADRVPARVRRGRVVGVGSTGAVLSHLRRRRGRNGRNGLRRCSAAVVDASQPIRTLSSFIVGAGGILRAASATVQHSAKTSASHLSAPPRLLDLPRSNEPLRQRVGILSFPRISIGLVVVLLVVVPHLPQPRLRRLLLAYHLRSRLSRRRLHLARIH